MGCCLSRFLSVSVHFEEVCASLKERGWTEFENEHLEVLKHALSITAVQISDEHVLVVVKSNATVMPVETYKKLNEYLNKAKYTPHALHVGDNPNHVFVRTWLLGPQTVAINLENMTEVILFMDSKVFVGNYAVSIMTEGVMFQSADEKIPRQLIHWADPLPSAKLAFWEDASAQGAVVWLFDKGYFKPVFQRENSDTKLSLRDIAAQKDMSEYQLFLEPHKERKFYPHDLAQLLANTSPNEDPIVRLVAGKLETMWWNKESGDKLIVFSEDQDIFVIAASTQGNVLKTFTR